MFTLDFDKTYRKNGDYTLTETGSGYTLRVKSGRMVR